MGLTIPSAEQVLGQKQQLGQPAHHPLQQAQRSAPANQQHRTQPRAEEVKGSAMKSSLLRQRKMGLGMGLLLLQRNHMSWDGRFTLPLTNQLTPLKVHWPQCLAADLNGNFTARVLTRSWKRARPWSCGSRPFTPAQSHLSQKLASMEKFCATLLLQQRQRRRVLQEEIALMFFPRSQNRTILGMVS